MYGLQTVCNAKLQMVLESAQSIIYSKEMLKIYLQESGFVSIWKVKRSANLQQADSRALKSHCVSGS